LLQQFTGIAQHGRGREVHVANRCRLDAQPCQRRLRLVLWQAENLLGKLRSVGVVQAVTKKVDEQARCDLLWLAERTVCQPFFRLSAAMMALVPR
jgi:hypothetical protein